LLGNITKFGSVPIYIIVGLILGAGLVCGLFCVWIFLSFQQSSSNQDTVTQVGTATPTINLLTAAPIRVVTNTPRFFDRPTGVAVQTTPSPVTPTSSATASPTPSPSQTTGLLGQNCDKAPGDAFAAIWSGYRSQLGCPLNDLQILPTIAEERFQGGHMFWRSDTDRVYIVYDRDKDSGDELQSGSWELNPTSRRWDGSNPDGVGLSPPSGFVEPARGFGWLWRTHLGGANGLLGWALDREYGFDNIAIAQTFEQGVMFKGSGSKIYVLLDDGRFFTQ
jgi:hypothetical protein